MAISSSKFPHTRNLLIQRLPGLRLRFSFAWFKANAAVSVTDEKVGAGTLTVGASTADSVNGFTITPSTVDVSGSVAYTDAAGKTYVSIPKAGGGYTKKEATTTANKAVAVALKATVTYSGDLTAKTDVEALWAATVASVTLTVDCSAVGGSVVSGSAAAAVTDIRGVADATASSSGDLAKSKNDEDFTWSDASTTAELSFGTVYVALTGSDTLIVDAEHLPTYTLRISATHS